MGLRKAAATVGTALVLTTGVIQAETVNLLNNLKDKVQPKIEQTTAQDATRVNTAVANALQLKFTAQTKPKKIDILGGDGEPIFKFENGKLVLTDNEKFAKAQPLLDAFYNIQNTKLIKLTENGIIAILRDNELGTEQQNALIQLFLNAALGNGEVHTRQANMVEPHQINFKAIREMAGNPANVDEDGNINETKEILQKLIDQATVVPLDKLMQNPIFRENFQDARNLLGKSVELAKKGNLTDDDKILLAMEQYEKFKAATSTVDMQDMRNFLIFYTGDISYDDPNKISDKEVFDKYIDIMKEYEEKFGEVAELAPDNNVKVDADELW